MAQDQVAGARSRTRTGTSRRTRDFKSHASTNFAIRARARDSSSSITPLARNPPRTGRDAANASLASGHASNDGEDIAENGGQARNRTEVRGFAGRCITTLPPGRSHTSEEPDADKEKPRPSGRGFSAMSTWSGKRDSNSRPQPWQGCALPLSYSRAVESAYSRAKRTGVNPYRATFSTAQRSMLSRGHAWRR